MSVLNKNNNPLYKQVSDYILNKIKDNTFQIGDAIPTEKELCDKFDVSRNTVRRGVDDLVQQGYLNRIQGNGTFVNSKNKFSANKSNQIGVILPTNTYHLHVNYLHGIEKALSDKNFRVVFVDSNSKLKKQNQNIKQLKSEGIKGLIIDPVARSGESMTIFELKKEGYPFVLIDRKIPGCKTNFVGSDNINGAYQATEYLIELGHKNIAFICGDQYHSSSLKDRITGYQEALYNYDFANDRDLVISFNKNLDKEEMLSQILKEVEEKNITGIVASSDMLAIEIIKKAKVKNISIPEDLSIIGFDNIESGKHIEVPLTTVAQFPEEIGKLAADLLVETIKEDRKKLTKEINHPEELIIRQSCVDVKKS